MFFQNTCNFVYSWCKTIVLEYFVKFLSINLTIIIRIKLPYCLLYLLVIYMFVQFLHRKLDVSCTYLAIVIGIELLKDCINFSLTLVFFKELHNFHRCSDKLSVIDHMRT